MPSGVDDLACTGVAQDAIQHDGRVDQVAGDVLSTDRIGGNLPAEVGAEAGAGPGQEIRHHLFINSLLLLEQPQDPVSEELGQNLRVGRDLHR